MGVPGARGFLLLRRAGGVWGIANEAVDGLSRQGTEYRIAVGAETLAADEIVGVVETLRVRPAAPALRRFWPEASAGVAVHGGLPVMMVDPLRPPAVLRCERRDEGEEG
ncbi:MAG TPA: hypothetical protein VIE43_08950 [Thermoanaerobaculia bacterium]|jgi:hypothetical protein|nr:hypothetical protein [Thermoanaerobaculia bacterium]